MTVRVHASTSTRSYRVHIAKHTIMQPVQDSTHLNNSMLTACVCTLYILPFFMYECVSCVVCVYFVKFYFFLFVFFYILRGVSFGFYWYASAFLPCVQNKAAGRSLRMSCTYVVHMYWYVSRISYTYVSDRVILCCVSFFLLFSLLNFKNAFHFKRNFSEIPSENEEITS